MTDINRIKKLLSNSTTMPAGSGGAAVPHLFGNHGHSHTHSADGSCCGHDHHDHVHDDNCDDDCGH